jgi:ACS family D-galactonate transporter-like MFS transporter
MVTVFGYTEEKANSLANYYWITNAIVLVLAGFASDAVRVRKPFMIVGALISMVGAALFARAATHPETDYSTLAIYFVIGAAGGGMAYVTWMAGFTETVEKHNPAATATGLAVWGWILRIIVTLSFALLPVIVPATTDLVDEGPRVAQIAEKYPQQVETLGKVDPAVLAALDKNPDDQTAQAQAISQISGVAPNDVGRTIQLGTQYQEELETAQAIEPATLQALTQDRTDQAAQRDAVGQIASKLNVSAEQAGARLKALGRVPPQDLAFVATNGPKVQKAGAELQGISKVPEEDLAYLGAHGADVAKAQEDNPEQWQTWWWICVAAQALFIPFVFIMAGHWSPRKAREEEAAHEAMVQRELAALEGRHL